MDLNILMTAFTTLFLAEMGDKTQLAVITLTASSGKPFTVFLGAVAALVAVTALGVVFGQGAVKLVPEAVLQRIAATVFIGLGVWMWVHP
ncbi:MAG: TMEM165/GDT1 family protein [Elusimicrobia bacterium]|nr:TMEM165/GDT1 family protein [Elusimicrobiota bacterium]